MDRRWRETFALHAQTPEFNSRLVKSLGIIKKALREHKKAYVSFSGGKDSTVLMHLVLSIDPNVLVVHWDYGPAYIPRPLHREILRIAEKCGARNLRILTSKEYWQKGHTVINALGRHFIGIEIPKLIREGYTLCFLGLRSEESYRRKHRLKDYFEEDPKGIVNCFPLRDWSWLDVWAYIVSRNLPYLSSFYDRYGPLVGYDKARFVTLFDPEFDIRMGSSNIDSFLMWRYRWSGERAGGRLRGQNLQERVS